MAVEIYQEPELSSMVGDENELKEWKKLVKSLDLHGQQGLISGDSKSPSIYLSMNNSMINMFKVLCPKISDYKSYSQGTIPTEVLKEILLSVHESYFDKINIWYDDIEPDPIAVGTKSNKNFLIARWGDKIIPFEGLMIKAKNRLLKSVKDQVEQISQRVESKVDEFLDGRNVYESINFVPDQW